MRLSECEFSGCEGVHAKLDECENDVVRKWECLHEASLLKRLTWKPALALALLLGFALNLILQNPFCVYLCEKANAFAGSMTASER